MLFVSRLFLYVDKWLSSFIMCICLLNRYPSNVYSLLLLRKSCHEVDMELLSIAISKAASFACCIIASIFRISMSICRVVSKSMLVIIIFGFPVITSNLTSFSSDIYIINIVTKLLFFTSIFARSFPSPYLDIINFLDNSDILLQIVYDFSIKKMFCLPL